MLLPLFTDKDIYIYVLSFYMFSTGKDIYMSSTCLHMFHSTCLYR